MMPGFMDKLSAVFENPDINARKAQLAKLARSLNINTAKIKNENEDFDENKLAVLIFEELKTGRQKKHQRWILIILGALLFILGTLGMYAASRAVMSMTKPSQGIILE